MLVPVILAGGTGSRLWPLSRDEYPKQFIPLLDSEFSLLQLTLKRLRGLEQLQSPILLCNETHRFMVAEQLRKLGVTDATILLEPSAKNTAPAVALAAYEALAQYKDAVLLVLPSDHLIRPLEKFQEALKAGLEQACEGKLVTFGIRPTRPETGYGYIKTKEKSPRQSAKVERFVEKPDLKTAQEYLDSGHYFWNSGVFMFGAAEMLKELKAHAPDIEEVCQQAFQSISKDLDFNRVSKEIYDCCRADSIDYAIMERTKKAVVVPLDVEWNDMGAWDAIWNACPQDEAGNALVGDVVAQDSANNYVRAESRLVSILGVDELVVVETSDSVLVAHKDRVQGVKQLVEKLRSQGRREALHHAKVYRPWGSYETIALAPRFQAKRIIVNPGASLSLQLHHHRAEHWVVVSGRATVTRGEDLFQLNEDESTYIPIGMKHRLHNPGVIPLEIIEVQSGSYLGEDDIVRFEDNYGRGK